MAQNYFRKDIWDCKNSQNAFIKKNTSLNSLHSY